MSTDSMADFSPVELLELFQRAQNQFTDRVDAVAPDQWEDPALPDWTVADLVAHLVTEQLWVPPLLAGEPYATRAASRTTPPTCSAATRSSAGSPPPTRRCPPSPRTTPCVRTVHLSRGPTPATAVHPRDDRRPDRARLGPRAATDGDTELDGELVTAALVFAEQLPEDGVPGLFDPPLDTSASASPQQRLLARFGRKA